MSVSVTNLGIEGIEEIEQIGSGGSSRVYRARQTDLDRVVAIKVINAGQTDDVIKERSFAKLALATTYVYVAGNGEKCADIRGMMSMAGKIFTG